MNPPLPNVFPPAAGNPLRTHADVQRLATDLATPLTAHFSPGRAQVRVGALRAHYGDPAGWLEGFARPLWGLAPLEAGGGEFPHWPLWQQGLEAGTDPAHAEYWGLAGDYDQRSVEQAAFGFSLALCPEKFWAPLSADARARLVAWLDRINHVELVRSNWLFFRLLVNAGLERVGAPADRARCDADAATLDSFYLGDGWYSDGKSTGHYRDGRLGDYYIPMAFHFYSLVLARLDPAPDPARLSRTAERARRFAEDFQHWFAADGSALPFGRSLTYRFAQGAFWGALAFAGIEALPWGVIKGLYLRHLRWWMSQPIFTDTGLLTVGYAYPGQSMAESYNSAQSPYWAMKAFLPLALPATHPFWRAEEAPLPPRPRVRTVPGAKLILQTLGPERDVVAVNPGQPTLDWPRHAPHKYSKCAYATRAGFAVPAGVATLAEGGLDSVISLSDDGRYYRVREQCFNAEVRDGVAFSTWSPWPGVELATWALAEADGHLRLHRLRTDRKLWIVEAGFALPFTDKTTRELLRDAPAGPVVRAPVGASLLRPLLGAFAPDCVELGAGSHLLASLSAMPVLKTVSEPGETWLAVGVELSAERTDAFTAAPAFEVRVETGIARVRRAGVEWWNSTGGPCGTSVAARRASLAALA